jgi:hypothetical protein
MWGIMELLCALSDVRRRIGGMITMPMAYPESECDFDCLMIVAMSNENLWATYSYLPLYN